MRQKNKGFTLVELIVVIAVLAILAALALPAFKGLNQESEQEVCWQNMRMLERNFLVQSALGQNSETTLEERYDSFMETQKGKKENNGYQGLCPADGVYTATFPNGMLHLTCSIHGEAEPLEANQQGIAQGGYMAEHMKDLCEELMDKTNTERKEYFASQGFNIPDNNLTNDTYRKFLYQQVYQGTWPTLSEEFKSLHQLSGDYYIQPYVYDVKKPEDVITFANHHNDIKQGNWNAYLIYHKDEKVWYTGAKPLMLAGKTWDAIQAEMKKNNWYALS